MTDDEFNAYFRRTLTPWIGRVRWAGGLSLEDAEEITSQLFMEMYKQVDSIADAAAADRFMRLRMKSRIIDFYRRSDESRKRELLPDCDVLNDRPAGLHPSTHPEEWLEFEESGKTVADTLNCLSPADRVHLRMRWLGFGASECAAVLEIKPGAERVRWHRLKKRLVSEGLIREAGAAAGEGGDC
ncbi:sigma-70 family RNA polymerase sigma factor [Streptomyces noursei]|uniref:RNA polymerase sigma factor n=1 Tax=Streptomyces noursei TaxID=1971 RepID=UPI00344F4EEB